MPVELDLIVPNPALLLSRYSHIKVYRAPTQAGPFTVEASSPTTRIPIERERIAYVFIDSATPNATSWYVISYLNSRTGEESGQGDPVLGQVDPALDVISVAELKQNYLFGVDLTDDLGVPYPDSLFQWYIRSAVSSLEKQLDIPLRRQVILDEQHDYRVEEFTKYQQIQTHLSPVISIEQVRLVLPAQQTVHTYPPEWIVMTIPEAGIVEIVPGSGALNLPVFGGAGTLMPFVYGGLARYVPSVFHIDYTAGFVRGQVPQDIRDVAGMLASFGPLNIAGDMLGGAGIASFSLGVDGLSQSIQTTSSPAYSGYGARLGVYRAALKDMIPKLRHYYKGIRLVIA